MSNTQTPAKAKVFRIGLECKDIWDVWDIFLYDLCHTYKSCKVKYSHHHSLICKLQLIVFCHLRPSSLWDKGPSCHSASQQHLSTLLSVLEVAAAWCPVTGRSPGVWRWAALSQTAEMSPCLLRQEVHGAVYCDWGSPEAGVMHVPSSKASLNMGLGLTSSPLQKFSAEAFFQLWAHLYLSGRCLCLAVRPRNRHEFRTRSRKTLHS